MPRPLNQAHRGASAYAPENTLAAFRLAREMGADSVELDVMLTRDGVPVISHDEKLGRAIEGTEYVADLTLAELKQRDAGSWKGPQYAGERVPTLDEALDELAGLIVNIELKGDIPGLEEKVADSIRRHGGAESYIASSFHPAAIARMKRLMPELQVAFIYTRGQWHRLEEEWPEGMPYPEAVHPTLDLVDEEYMRWARDNDFVVRAWIADEPDQMRRLIALGVESVVSNKPDVLTAVLAESATAP